MTTTTRPVPASPAVSIFHIPACGTSRQVLALIREHGFEPAIVEYLKNPPSRAQLEELLAAMGIPVRDLLRAKEARHAELRLDDAKWRDDELIGFIADNPILMNRPVVVTALGARLCRPAQRLLELLPPA